MATNNSIGLNIELPIYNSNGSSFHGLVLHKCTYDSVVMSLGDKITGDVYYNGNTLAVTMQEYVELDGVKFVLVTPPTVVREGMVSENSQLKGMTKYSFVFYHPMYMLGNFPFTDVAVTSSEAKYLSESKKFTWIGYPDDFIAKVNKNLDGTEWIVEKSSRFPAYLDDQLSDVLPFDGNTIADACKIFYDTWGAPYIVAKVESTEAAYANGKRFKVIFGLPSNEIYEDATHQQSGTPYIFRFGNGVGLKNNSRTPRGNKIVTRIAGSGSENNIPYGYPQIPWYGDSRWDYTEYEGSTINYDSDGHVTNTPKTTAYPLYMGIVGGAYVKLIKHPFTRTNLMPSIYGQTLFNKVSPYLSDGTANPDYDPNTALVDYYDAIATQEYPYPNPIVANAPSYESHQFEDIKPELGQNVAIVDAYPVNKDMTPAQAWDDSMDDDGNYVQSYFKMQLPVLSFDLYACAAITQEMQINMRSGACLGCTFTVQVDWDDYKRNFYDEDGNFAPTGSQRDYTKYPDSTQEQITVVLQKETATFGTLMPNTYQYPVADDTFVVLGISLPLSYIESAEERLDGEMKSYMLENNVHYFDYPLKFDEAFLRNNPYILSQIKPNSIVRFQYGNDTMQLFVKQMTVKYGEGVLPKYDITLTDNVEVVLNQIGQVADDVEKLSSLIAVLRQSYNRNVWNELAKKLSKTQDDTAAGFITMLKGLQVGNQFVSGLLGEGGVFRKDADGKTYLEADKMYIRMRAYFDTVEVREYKHSAGNRVASPAGAKCVRVAWFNSSNEELEQTQENLSSVAYFRCYFRASDNEDTVRNNFVIGDQVYCHITTVNGADDNPSTKGLNQKHYWRLCIGKNTDNNLTEDGEGWVDLSNRSTESIGGKNYTGYQTNSDVPEPQDSMVQLGNVNDTTRQGAIIEFVGGENAPAYQIYQGINTYSLSGKCMIDIGFDSQTGLARMNVAGNFRFGSPDNTGSYIKYDSQANQGQGQLDIKAHVEFTNSDQELENFVQSHQRDDSYDDTEVRGLIDGLQDQIDGQIDSWFYNYAPVAVDSQGAPTSNVPSNVEPYKSWNDADVAAGNDAQKIAHLGDTFTNNKTGYCWRFTRNPSTNAFEWTIIQDSAVITALQNAARAQDTADHKRRVFLTQPTPPYDAGDMWVNAVYPVNYTGVTDEANHNYNNDILKCVTAKASDGSFSINDWALASKYTDDSKFNGYISALLNNTGLSGDSAAAAVQNAILGALGVGTVVAGGLLLTSLIGMRQYNGSGDKSDVSNYTTWAGISGQYNANVLGGGMAAWYGGGMLDKETLTDSQISQGWSTLRWAKGVDRFDGSGYRADGNLSWDKDGIMTIANVYSDVNGTLVPWSGTTLQYMTNLSNIMPISLVGGVTYLDPQVGFKQLSVLGKEVATKEWVNGNFVTKTFFDNLFRVYNGSESAANKIDVNGTLPSDTSNLNIEAMFGFWTKKYISALGQGDDGSVSYTTLAQLNDVQLGTLTNGDTLVYNATLNKWENKQIDVGVDMSVVWDALLDNTNEQINISHITTALSNYITYDNLSTILTGYATSTQLNALEFLNQVTCGNGVLKLITNKSTEYDVDLSHEHSFLELLDRPDTIAGYGVTLTADDIPMLTKSKISDFPTTWAWSAITGKPNSIAGYGILDAKIENGVITLGGNSITPLISETYRGTVVSVGLSVPAGFSVSGTPITDSGTLAIAFASGYEGFTTDLKNKINALFSWFEVDADGNIKTKDYTENNETKHRGFYSPSFISALGMGDDGQAGQGDVTWALLASPATDGRTIHSSYIAAALAGYATQNWVQQQGYITSAQLSALEYLQTITGGDEVATFTTNKGTETVLDFSHEHSWFELLDKPDTIAGLGVALSASDIPNLDWSKITTGKPTTLAGYGITDAVASISINGTSYLPSNKVVTLPVYTSTQVDALARLKTLALTNDGVLTFTHQDNSTSVVDFSHEHSFLELVDRPTTIKGYGITDAITTSNIGSQSVNYATTAGGVSWANVSNKPSAAGNGTTPVYWTGSGFTACTPYSSASVNYANSAGSASQLSTPRTLWGQSFNGTGNVSGSLSGVGHLSFGADNTYDVGASGTRVRSGYFGTYLLCDAIEIGHTNEINTTSGVLYLQYRSPATNLVLCYNGGNVGVGNSSPSYRLDVSGVIYSNTGVYSAGYVTALSDARHKTIVRNTNISVEQIAAMRSVVYRWNDRQDNSLHVGSIAQDWQGVLPQVVSVADDKEHTLGLQYGVAALIAVITTARKVVDHEKRIAELEKERDDWKEAYSFIKNAYEELKLKIA